MIKVSVCIPIYNVSAYIERCARSLFGQTCREVEYIFIDDCSPDNSGSCDMSRTVDCQQHVIRLLSKRKVSILCTWIVMII